MATKKKEVKEIKTKETRMTCMDKLFIAMVFIFLVYTIDHYTKYLSSFVYGCVIFCMKHSVNYGAAFNLLQGFSWTRVLLIFVALIVLGLTAYFYCTIPKFKTLHFGLIFLFAGTLCNMLDRLVYGYVIDWLSFSFMPMPALNIADLSNIAGVIILIVVLLKKK